MAINKRVILALLLASSAAWSREAASPSACQAAAAEPAISHAKAALEHSPQDLKASFQLADAWSDAGCFTDALQVLQAMRTAHSENQELQTRLRVARSLVGEEHFFDNIDRADAEAKLKRATFRCSSLGDLDACSEALRLKPGDPTLIAARADATAHADKPASAMASSQPESAPPAVVKLQVADAPTRNTTARRYSNAAPETQSH